MTSTVPGERRVPVASNRTAGSPFPDYRWPGVLLAGLVGGGYLATGLWQRRSGRSDRTLSVCAGAALVAVEACELLWLGFQPLEAAFAVVGAAVAAPALRAPSEHGLREASQG